jgi:hypothetical protein
LAVLSTLSLADMTRLSADLRAISGDSVAAVAEQAVRYLYDTLTDSDGGDRACALVRIYITYRCADLPPEVCTLAGEILGTEPSGDVRCFTLLATAGDEPAWNDPALSKGHRTIPLPSVEAVAQIPMLAALIQQLGFELSSVVHGTDLVVNEQERTYSVFHIPEALDSPYIPAQDDFVVPHAIRSVVGFGGLLPDNELFAAILFAKVPISRSVAELFGPVALSLKLALLSPATKGTG